MNRYWDLSEKQRSELTYEQVEAMLAVELMEKGVTKIDPPELLPVEFKAVPTTRYFTIKRGYRGSDVAWPTAEDAARAMAGSVVLDHDYIGSKSVKYACFDEITIEGVDVAKRDDILAVKSDNDKADANKKSNDAATKAYNEACKAVTSATSGVWEDYRECVDKARRLKKVVDTFKQYCELCNGELDVAARFLAKAFPPQEIESANEWYDVAIPAATAPVAIAEGTVERETAGTF